MQTPDHLFNTTIQYFPRTGQNEFGKPTFGAAITIKARVEDTNERITGAAEQELIAIYKIYCAPTTNITTLGKILFEDKIIPILAIKAERGKLNNISHYKIWGGLTNVSERNG